MRILICDDHKIICEGLRRILQQLPGVTLIKEACCAEEALGLLDKNVFDIMLLDITLPDKSGLDIIEPIKAKYTSLNILMLSIHSEEQYAIRSFKLGASGYLTKNCTSEELLMAIKKIYNGGKYISQSIAENIALHLDKGIAKMKHEILSSRELEIMLKLVKGNSLVEIADELSISNKTVSTYRSRIMEKMGFSKNTELARYCIENNLA